MISTGAEDDLKLRVGDTDSHGDVVTRMYDRVDGKYIIYEIASGALKCGDTGIQLQQDEAITRSLMKIGDLIAVNPKLAKKYNSHRALGIRLWCRGETQAAARALNETFEMMLRTFVRRARLVYISGSFLVILAALAISASAAYLGAAGSRTWCLVSLFGALGAFVSAALRGQPPTLDVLEDRSATLAYGIVRAMIAIVFAFLMYLLVLGGVFLPELAHEPGSRLLVLAFAAGFSEKLVPEVVIHQAIGRVGHK